MFLPALSIAALNSSWLCTSLPATSSKMSPRRKPALAAMPFTLLTTILPLLFTISVKPAAANWKSSTLSPRSLLWRSDLAAMSFCVPSLISTSSICPLRHTPSFTVWLGLSELMVIGKSLDERTSLPFTLRIISPTFKPPRSAGLPASTLATSAPVALSSPKVLAKS